MDDRVSQQDTQLSARLRTCGQAGTSRWGGVLLQEGVWWPGPEWLRLFALRRGFPQFKFKQRGGRMGMNSFDWIDRGGSADKTGCGAECSARGDVRAAGLSTAGMCGVVAHESVRVVSCGVLPIVCCSGDGGGHAPHRASAGVGVLGLSLSLGRSRRGYCEEPRAAFSLS